MSQKNSLTTKKLVFSGMAVALAIVIATFIKLPSLPFGGSVTLFSMLLICLVGYWYGPATGFCASFTYGILQFITGPYVVHPLQVILDFPLAFGALGMAGLFHNAKRGLAKGYLAGVAGRFAVHCIAGAIFYTEYVGSFGGNLAALFSGIVYNMTYLAPEAAITLILISLPPVSRALDRLKAYAAET